MSTQQPDIGSWAEGVYDQLEPLAWNDWNYDWALAIMCGAFGVMFQVVEDLAGDGPNGEVGWSIIVDVNRAPDVALPWLAQFVGVTLVPGSTPDEQRLRIISTDGWWRGTPAAIVEAVKATLTGNRTVVLRERDLGSAYHLTVITFVSETPDQAASLAALISQKPAGIVLDYRVNTGQDYASLLANHPLYSDVKATYPDYNSVRLDVPA